MAPTDNGGLNVDPAESGAVIGSLSPAGNSALLWNDEEMAAYISAHPANYHITGSYEEHPKYTGYIDFSDMQPCEYTVTGRFGGCLYSGTIIYDAGLLDTPEADQKP